MFSLTFGTKYPDFCLKQRKYYSLMMAIDSSEIEGYAWLIKSEFHSSFTIINMHWYSDSFFFPSMVPWQRLCKVHARSA